jgi:hypothetical protein
MARIARSLGRFFLLTGFILGCLYLLMKVVGPGLAYAGFYFYRQSLAAVGAVGAMVSAAALVPTRDLKTKAKWLMSSVLALGLIAGLLYLGNQAGSRELVAAYCNFGVVSRSHVERCLDRVMEEQIWRSNTAAARSARHDVQECLAESGPFCALASMP